MEDNINYLGYDITYKKVDSFMECIDFTRSTPGGHFWTWNEKTNKNCHVKYSDAGWEHYDGVRSGDVTKCWKK